MIWLAGNRGMLGTETALLLEESGLDFFGTGRELDITDYSAVSAFEGKKESGDIQWIINCAAYTAVDKAEDDKEACRRLNETGAANLAAFAAKTGARLIHISTEYVFDGKGIVDGGGTPRPYREDDTPVPAGVYGQTKLDGELAVSRNNPASYIIRTAWLYGKYGHNFVRTMIKLMNEKESVSVVNDQRGSPTWTRTLAQAVLQLITAVNSGKKVPFGVYHFTGEGETTWFDFAKEIYKQGRESGCITKDCEIKPCASTEYPAKAKRPSYSVLDKTKIKTALDIEIPSWDASLREALRTFQ
jgi:dTDP-4-dehydrorhamnose reductase